MDLARIAQILTFVASIAGGVSLALSALPEGATPYAIALAIASALVTNLKVVFPAKTKVPPHIVPLILLVALPLLAGCPGGCQDGAAGGRVVKCALNVADEHPEIGERVFRCLSVPEFMTCLDAIPAAVDLVACIVWSQGYAYAHEQGAITEPRRADAWLKSHNITVEEAR